MEIIIEPEGYFYALQARDRLWIHLTWRDIIIFFDTARAIKIQQIKERTMLDRAKKGLTRLAFTGKAIVKYTSYSPDFSA